VTLAQLAMPPPPGSFTRGEAGVAVSDAAEHLRYGGSLHAKLGGNRSVSLAGKGHFVHAALSDGHIQFLLRH